MFSSRLRREEQRLTPLVLTESAREKVSALGYVSVVPYFYAAPANLSFSSMDTICSPRSAQMT